MNQPYLVGITGGSASGKTLFLNDLMKSFSKDELCVLSQDNYYRPREEQQIDENGVKNFDIPESIDHEAFARDVQKIKNGETVYRKEYTFNNPKVTPKDLVFKPAPVIVIEGIFVFSFKEVADLLDLKVFIDAKEVFSTDGELSEEEARDLLHTFDIVSETEQMRNQARELHLKGDTTEAIVLLSDAIKQDPSNTKIAMDMVQIFIDLDDLDQAGSLFNKLPDLDKNSNTGLSLFGQLQIKTKASQTAGLKTLKENIFLNPDDFDARLDCAICELAEANTEEALNHLFYIQEHKADYKEGAAKEMIIAIIDATMPVDPETARGYRAKLTALLET